MESVLRENLDLLFPGMEVEDAAVFRVTRNANTGRDEEEADDLLEMIQSEVRERRFAPVVRMEVERTMTETHRGMLAAELGLDDVDVFERKGILAMRDLMELLRVQRPELRYAQHHPVDHPDLVPDRNIFHIIRDLGSIFLHHPYTSFSSSVERFLREASRDPKVRALKMCLYRTSSDTKVIQHLVDAARNGKEVAVVVELKARFDEEANIRWAARMEEAGIHVTYGVVGLKTHCKAVLVVRQDYSGIRRYAHIGTGNYHAGTARLYSDVGLLTSDPEIGKDLTELFNYLTTGYRPKRHYYKILPAPKICKHGLLKRIRREVEHQSVGTPGLIQFKLNALEDPQITRALYEASQAGVQVDLIIRDTCRLRPGIPGLSDNVRVISVLGRFLEHARVYHFGNAGQEEYYIGSADAMRRNLNSRVEVLVPVEEESLRAELRYFLDVQLTDDRSAWEMQPDGSYVQRRSTDEKARGSQELLIGWHDRRMRNATRLRRRRPRGAPQRRNVRLT
jgi:polyphosphate kinase